MATILFTTKLLAKPQAGVHVATITPNPNIRLLGGCEPTLTKTAIINRKKIYSGRGHQLHSLGVAYLTVEN